MNSQAGDMKSGDSLTPATPMETKDNVAAAGGDGRPSANGDSATKRTTLGHPDPDSMKMFAGQIPRHMEEPELRKVFEEFGPLYELSILKDRVSGASRGCCFVTFMKRKDALEAQNKLHGVRILPTMHNPMQMKPADVEARSERKLFVGMIGRETAEDTVRSMFVKYGPIEECTVLRDAQKQSKGCAFVTFMSRKNAIAAIRGLHHSRTMDGCSAPLVVKFAEAQRDRNAGAGAGAGLTRLGGSQLGNANRVPLGTGFGSNWGNQQQQMPQQNMSQPPPNMNMNNPLFNNPQAVNLLQQLSNAANALSALAGGVNPQFGMQMPQANQQNMFGAQQNQQNNQANALAMMLQAAGNLNRAAGSQQQQTTQQFQPTLPTNTAGNFNNTTITPNATAGTSFPQQQQQPQVGGNTGQSLPLAQPANSNTPIGRQVEGPEGCNLFVYHLPEECTDADLSNMFSPFGNVISAKVFVDKETGQSKGFGFVSYDIPASAETAIQGMNSFLIGTKRLKVQPKRSAKDLAKPY